MPADRVSKWSYESLDDQLTTSNQDLVRPVLIAELRCIAFPRFLFWDQPGGSVERRGASTYEFDGDLLVVQEVGALENDTKRTFTNFLAHAVVNAHHVGGRGGHGCEMGCWRSGKWELESRGNGFRDRNT